MLQAWIVLPALYLAYILAAPVASLETGGSGRWPSPPSPWSPSRSAGCASWPSCRRTTAPTSTAAATTPCSARCSSTTAPTALNGNVLDQPGCSQATGRHRDVDPSGGADARVALQKGPGRFPRRWCGRDAAWLFVPSLVALGGVLVARRREPRTDPRAGGRAPVGHLADHDLVVSSPPRTSSTATTWPRWPADGGAVRSGARTGLEAARATRDRAGGRDGTVVAGVAYDVLPGARGRRGPALGRGHQPAAGRGGGARLSWPFPSGGERRRLARAAVGLGLAVVALLARHGLGRRRPPWRTGCGPSTRRTSRPAAPAAEQAGGPTQVGRLARPRPPPWRTSRPPRASRRPRPPPRSSLDVLASGRRVPPGGRVLGPGAEHAADPRSSTTCTRAVVDVLVPVAPRTRNPDMRWVLAHCASPDAALPQRCTR